jgi:ABC-type glutathione transport system ATPase component
VIALINGCRRKWVCRCSSSRTTLAWFPNWLTSFAVMYLGTVVERASVRDLIRNPLHPYTAALIGRCPVSTKEENDSQPSKAASHPGAYPVRLLVPPPLYTCRRGKMRRGKSACLGRTRTWTSRGLSPGGGVARQRDSPAKVFDMTHGLSGISDVSPKPVTRTLPLLEVQGLCRYFPVLSQG